MTKKPKQTDPDDTAAIRRDLIRTIVEARYPDTEYETPSDPENRKRRQGGRSYTKADIFAEALDEQPTYVLKDLSASIERAKRKAKP